MIVSFAAARAGCHAKIGARWHCLASARAAAKETRKMITVPWIYECLLQGTMSLHLNYSCTYLQRPPWGQKKVAIVERLKQK